MRYKVGDRVRYIKYAIYHTPIVKENSIWKIIKVDAKNRMYLTLDETNHKEWFKEEELQKVEYTYEELKKSPIGTKVTFESGNIIIKVKENYYCNNLYFRNDNDLKGLKDTISLNKIIKIEEPIYTTVYEKKEILDEAEKRYLRNFIRPFRDNVKYIKKTHYRYEKSKIEICVNGYIEEANISDTYYTFLPAFSTNEMYNGMTLEKEYTLEELGL